MKNFIADNSARIRGRRGVDEPEPAEPTLTEVLPETSPGLLDDWQAEGSSATGYPTVGDGPASPVAEEEPFVPKPRYVMDRSTKVLVCVLLVAAGVFAGSAVQKQLDAGDRAARTNFGNFQGPGAGTGTGAGTGNSTTGQGRRNGGTGTGGAPTGGAGTGTPSGAPAQGPGQ